MKKLMLSLAVACASAIAAFAGGPTWFAEAVSVSPSSGDWKVGTQAADLSALMGGTSYITYKDMENDLVFTANTEQTLPGDEATVNTTVKFTAMAMEDFVDLTNANASAWADAKGGLTIIEDPENNYKFYGLVNGTWQELANGTTVTAAGIISGNTAVPVEVKIWENNGRKISYKVGTDFIGGSADGLTASGSGSTISQIAYRGNCEISSLTGNRANEMWEITLTDLLNAIATLNVGAETYPVPDTGKVSIRATKTDSISVSYAPDTGFMFFPTTGGAGRSEPVESTATTVTGSQAISAAVAGYTYAKVVAKVDDTDCYDTLAKALAAGSGKTVTVVAEPETTAQAVSFTTSLNAAGFTVAGDITIADNAALTILGGNFSGTITGALLISGPSTFAQIDKDTASGLCATGWFAKAGDPSGSVVEAGVAPTEVVPGVTISYDENEVTLEELQAPETETGNGKPGWVNYALGLDNTTTEKPNIVKAAADKNYLKLAASTKGRPGTGYVLKITTPTEGGEDEELTEGNLDLASVIDPVSKCGTCVIKSVLKKDKAEDVLVSTKTIGVKLESVSLAESTDAKLITVPYVDINAGDLTIDTVINKENIGKGSILSAVSANNSYVTWKKTATGWEYQKKSGTDPDIPASEYVVKPGQALWLQAAENSSFYQFGEVATKFQPVQLTANAYNLLASPSDAETATLEIVKKPSVNDAIRIERATGTPEEFLCTSVDDKGVATWQWTHKVGFRTKIEEVDSKQTFELGAGAFMWYDATSGSKASVQW